MSEVDWYAPMTKAETRKAQRADEYVSRLYTGEVPRVVPAPTASLPQGLRQRAAAVWRSVILWCRSLWK